VFPPARHEALTNGTRAAGSAARRQGTITSRRHYRNETEVRMGKAYYDIIGSDNRWGIRHDDDPTGDYASKEAAFEAAVAAASNAIKFGHEVRITVPGNEGSETNLGVITN
jgi:hypothetical protein